MARRVLRLLLVTLFVAGPLLMAAAAHAHGDDEGEEGFVLVQQALAHLAHDNPEAIDAAMEKVDDVLAAEDQEGVDVPAVRQGLSALESGDVDGARALLQDSIAAALTDMPLATGYATGTGVVPPELPGRGPLTGGDWLVMGLFAAVAGVGVWLSVRFRPHESVGALRLLLGTMPNAVYGSRQRVPVARHPR